MLLNTSLNIKGEPLVNTWDDVMRFRIRPGSEFFDWVPGPAAIAVV